MNSRLRLAFQRMLCCRPLVISSDKTLAARAALRIWVELMKRKRGPSWACTQSSFTITPLALPRCA
jgi:hypothetical protein